MANIRHFGTIGGETVLFDRVDHRPSGKFGWHPETKAWIKVERSIEYKAFASKHECDERCMNATGRIMKCECRCGGKNHGKGNFKADAA